jgi:hypothetical protein
MNSKRLYQVMPVNLKEVFHTSYNPENMQRQNLKGLPTDAAIPPVPVMMKFE